MNLLCSCCTVAWILRKGVALLAISAIVTPMFAAGGLPIQTSVVSAQQEVVSDYGEQIRKELVSIPSFGVFDDLRFQINDSVVTLTGYASRPILKSHAERLVASVEGIQSVVNKIEVLPLSSLDNGIRLKTYLAIYRNPDLQRYSTGSSFMPRLALLWATGGITNDPPVGWHPIHIIVRNGNVTLTGIVDCEIDKTIAGMTAKRVSGAFLVTNALVVAGSEAKRDNTNKDEL